MRRVGLEGGDRRARASRAGTRACRPRGRGSRRAPAGSARSRPQCLPWAPAGSKSSALDAPAQVLAQQVGRVLVSEAGRDHGELRVRRGGLADAAQRRAQLGQAVRDEGDDADAGAVRLRSPARRTGVLAGHARQLPAHELEHLLGGGGHRRRELLAERLDVFRLDGEHDDLLGHVVAEPVPELERRVEADGVGGAVAVSALEVLGLVPDDLAGLAPGLGGALQCINNDNAGESAHKFEQAKTGDLALTHLHAGRQRLAGEPPGDEQPDPVVRQDRVAHAEHERGAQRHMFLLTLAMTSRVASLLTVTSSGMSPGSVCVAQPKHGS